MIERDRPVLLVLASTYPRWVGDHEPGFVHELARRLTGCFRVIALVPHAAGAKMEENVDGVEVRRYRYAPKRWETLVHDGGMVTHLKRSPWKWLLVPGFFAFQYLAARRIAKREHVEVIHAHWLIPQGLIAACLGRIRGRRIPFLVTSHGADLYALNGALATRLKRLIICRAAAMTTVSSSMRARALALGARSDALQTIPMGVDFAERFTVDPAASRSATELLFVGRLVEKKGLRHLLDALPVVMRTVPDVHLTIAGFGPEQPALEAQASRLGIGRRVTFLGAVKQSGLQDLYRRAALFVAPFVVARSGDQEGLPVALMEALACGCPVVAGRIPGIDDLTGELTEQVCVDARDAKALAVRILEMLRSPAHAKLLAEQLRTAASGLVDWNSVAGKYAALLFEVGGQRRCP